MRTLTDTERARLKYLLKSVLKVDVDEIVRRVRARHPFDPAYR